MPGGTIKTAVIITTANRPDSLAETLAQLATCDMPADLHVIVADNGQGDATERICRAHYGGLRVEHSKTPPGKSRAQNRAADLTDAELLVFTDDDVNPSPGWLVEIERAAREYPDHMLLGGPITPLYPGDIPTYLEGSAYLGHLFSRLERSWGMGPVKGFHPFGPNMTLRRTAFERGIRFDESIGPGTEGTWMGEDTQIARQVAAAGQDAVYVPGARVYHRIRPDQLSLRWQLDRGVKHGRALAHLSEQDAVRIFGVPRWAIRAIPEHCLRAAWKAASRDRTAAFDELMQAALSVGRSIELRQMGQEETTWSEK